MEKFSLAKDKIKILLLEGLHQSAVQTFKDHGYSNIEYLKTSLPEDELIERIRDAHFIGIRSRTQLTDKVLERSEERRVVKECSEPCRSRWWQEQ